MADNKRLYQILQVAEDADERAIKKAYRRLAMEYHPDKNKTKEAEEKFKEINLAHEVLSNPERRKLYDQYGEISLDPNFNPEMYEQAQYSNPFGAGGMDFSDLFGGYGSTGGFDFSDLFNARQSGSYRQTPVQGDDRNASLTIDFMEAINGKTQTITLDVADPDGQGGYTTREATLEVKIPAGIRNGQKIRIPGKGQPGIYGGPNGDLYIEIKVKDDPVFKREGNDITVTVPVSLIDAVLGSTVEVPTVYGPVDLKIPAGIQPGQKMRLAQKGVKTRNGVGDEYAQIKVEIPKNLSDEQKEILHQIQQEQAASSAAL